MESKPISKIIIPSGIHIAWERNFSFLSTFLIAQQHIKELNKYLNVKYSMCAFFSSQGQVQFFRSELEEDVEGKLLADRCLEENKNLIQKIEEKDFYYKPCSNIEIIDRLVINLQYAYDRSGHPEKALDLKKLLRSSGENYTV